MIPVVFALLFCHALGQLQLPAHFNWSDCGPADRKIHISNLRIDPVPVKLPGPMTVTLEGTIDGTLPVDVTMDANVKKWTLGHWATLPCLHNVGTCHYDNPCDFLNTFATNGCPQQLIKNGLPCTCPFAPERLHMTRELFNVTQIPDTYSRFVEGSYRYHLEVKQAGHIIGCLDADITMASAHSGFLFG
ncbi:hypothetical protein CHS0354_018763 [Potamilus streckersoni]|uniref:MD-2-related lipid-recognition domain-containing protein n=1 Tax=Potamilus streckersoni TaxID=2493646 RepID=A0AAE0T3N1_9BIVA|nr:hypothetical protein CHS0354_018763 [Potamilus streckersoni]